MDSLTFSGVIAAAFLHALWNVAAKRTAGNTITLLWLGQLLGGVALLPFALFTGEPEELLGAGGGFVLVSGIIHALYIALLGWAYTIGDISVVYPVARGLGIAGTAVGATLLGIDTVSAVGVAGVLSVVVGSALIGLVEMPHAHRRFAFFAALLVGVCVAGYSIVDKLGMRHTSPFLYVTGLHVASPLILAPFIRARLHGPLVSTWRSHKGTAFAIGVAGLVAYMIILWAFQRTEASYVVALRETSVVVGSVLGFWVLKERVLKRKVFGILLIVVGAVCIRLA